MMSQDKWEFVRAIYDDWEQGDFSSAEWAARDIELVVADGPTPGTWRGREEMASAWRDVLSSWADLRCTAEGFRELDGERLLVLTRNSGRGKASGFELGEMRTRGANVVHIRDRKVTRLVAYWNRDQAFSDLDLEG